MANAVNITSGTVGTVVYPIAYSEDGLSHLTKDHTPVARSYCGTPVVRRHVIQGQVRIDYGITSECTACRYFKQIATRR